MAILLICRPTYEGVVEGLAKLTYLLCNGQERSKGRRRRRRDLKTGAEEKKPSNACSRHDVEELLE
jgi:hypothetical protein